MSILKRIAVGLCACAAGIALPSVAPAQLMEADARKPPRDTRAPRLATAAVNGKRVTLTFDERLRAGSLNPTAIKVTLNGRRTVVRSARATRRAIEVVLGEQAFGDDAVSASFLRDSGGAVPRDVAGNEARAFVRRAANRSLPGCTPTLGVPGDQALSPSSFPRPGEFAPARGDVRAIALFVDFPDVGASEAVDAVAGHVLGAAPHWYAGASYGRLRLRIDRVDRWLRVARASTSYGITRTTFGDVRALVADAVAAADAEVDFRPYRLVYVVAARNSGVTYSPAYVLNANGVRADGNELRHGAILGNDSRASFGAWTTVHETGHALGLPDLYSHVPVDGGSDSFVGNWDVMGSHRDGAGFLAWQRWRLRWLDAGQLRCPRAQTEIELTPLDAPGGVKAVVVPLDSSRAWVLEARRKQGIDSGLCGEGVLAYLVDTTVPTGKGPVRIRRAGGGNDRGLALRCGSLYDAPFLPVDGRRGFAEASFSFEVLAATAGGYRVRIAPPG